VTKRLNAEGAESAEKRRGRKSRSLTAASKRLLASVRGDKVWGWRKKIRENGKAGHFVWDDSG